MRTILITGASDGIGFEIACALAGPETRLLLPVRNREKGDRAVARIRSETPDAMVELLDLDLARLDTVAALCTELVARDDPIDSLVLNAGIVQLGDRQRHTTVDGFELTFQTNFLGHFALVRSLLPLLQRGAARVVVQCSLGAVGASVDWGDLRGEIDYRPFRAYRSSKAALGLFGVELARRSAAAGWGITVQLCHPGIAPGSAIAPAVRAVLPDHVVEWVVRRIGNPPNVAAQTALAALVAAPAAGPGTEPRMFVPSGPFELLGTPRERTPFRSLRRRGDAQLLWELASQWTGQRTP